MSQPQSKIGLWKNLAGNAAELLSIRLEMARLDVTAMIKDVLKIGLYALIAVFIFMAAFTALMFGLDAILPVGAKVWVFLGLAIIMLGMVSCLLIKIKRLIDAQENVLADSIQGMREDLAFIRNEREFKDLKFKEWRDE